MVQAEYQTFLREIGYLVEEPALFAIGPKGVDEEVAQVARPQLVVPVLNARFLLDAPNARWGSLNDPSTEQTRSPAPSPPAMTPRAALG
jgi:malate synthase